MICTLITHEIAGVIIVYGLYVSAVLVALDYWELVKE